VTVLVLLLPNTGANWVNSNSYYFNAATGLSAFAVDTVTDGDNFTDLGFREAIKLMDDNNVPMDNRCLVIPPAARKSSWVLIVTCLLTLLVAVVSSLD